MNSMALCLTLPPASNPGRSRPWLSMPRCRPAWPWLKPLKSGSPSRSCIGTMSKLSAPKAFPAFDRNGFAGSAKRPSSRAACSPWKTSPCCSIADCAPWSVIWPRYETNASSRRCVPRSKTSDEPSRTEASSSRCGWKARNTRILPSARTMQWLQWPTTSTSSNARSCCSNRGSIGPAPPSWFGFPLPWSSSSSNCGLAVVRLPTAKKRSSSG